MTHRPDLTEQPFAVPLIAGMMARVFSVSVVSPLELIRTKMQSQKLSYYGRFSLNLLIVCLFVCLLYSNEMLQIIKYDLPFLQFYY